MCYFVISYSIFMLVDTYIKHRKPQNYGVVNSLKFVYFVLKLFYTTFGEK